MDLSTRYLGLELESPLVLGASPLASDVDAVRRCVDAGASLVVMHSLFEEQLTREELAHHRDTAHMGDAFAEAQSWLPEPVGFSLGPDEYLEQIRRLKTAVNVPVMGSLNGVTAQGWLRYAELIEQAGADALELNVYHLATSPEESADAVESRLLDVVSTVAASVDIPVAVKLAPFHTALAHFARRLTVAGARGLVLFNRFYHPDIDVEELDTRPQLELSRASELPLRLRWLAILFGRVEASLAVTGGVHGPLDALKAVMAGADAVQMVSAVLQGGPQHFARVRTGLRDWLVEHEYASLAQARGSMSLANCPDPRAYERANYVKVLQSWRNLGLTGVAFGHD